MIAPADVRRIAAALPQVEDRSSDLRLEFLVDGKGFAWSWMQRLAPKTPRVPRVDVLVLRCEAALKDLMLEALGDKLEPDPHYNGYPAFALRLASVDAEELSHLLTQAWRAKAPKALVKRFDADVGSRAARSS